MSNKPLKNTTEIKNLRDLVRSNAATFGDMNLYTYIENKTEKTISYREFGENINRLGTAFFQLGLMGKHIAVIGESHPAYMTTYHAATHGGGVIVPLDKEITDDEVVNFLNLSKADAVVYTRGQNDRIAHFADRCPEVKYFIPVAADEETVVHDKIKSFDELLSMGKKALEQNIRDFVDCAIDKDKMCAILFTSGTTGTSKGVMLSQHNLARNTLAAAESMGHVPSGTKLMSVLPMHHTYETTTVHMAAHYVGGSIFCNEDLKYVSKNINAWKPDLLVLVPLFVETMHKKVWEAIRAKGVEKKVRMAMKISNGASKIGINLKKKLFGEITAAFGGNLKGIVCGAAPLNPQLITDFRAFGINIQEGYGITECSPLVAVNTYGKERLRSVGKTVRFCQVKIDIDNPELGTGEILVKGDNVMLGYYNNEEATSEVMTDDGHFRTGDIGYMDKDGYLYITGRKKNVIILSNGKNIYPEEIEEYLAPSELIAECAVVGRKINDEVMITVLIFPDAEKFEGQSGEEIHAKLKAEVDAINENLPSFKKIRHIEVRDSEFEKTTTRKIKRHKL